MTRRDYNAYGAVIITFTMATIFVISRFTARRMTKVQLWWDDYFSGVTFFFAVGFNAVMLRWLMVASLGRKLSDFEQHSSLSQDQILTKSRQLLWNGEIFYACSLAFAKMSILALYWRLFKTSKIRLPIQILFVSAIIWLTIRTFMAIFHCIPVQAFWDHTIEGAVCNIDDSKFFFGTVLTHLIIDIAILILPVVEVRRLQLRQGRKIGVILLFMFGIFVCVASIVVVVESAKFNPASTEMPLDVSNIMIWATVEVNLAIISACLPMMRPIARKFFPGSMLSSGPSTDFVSKSGTHGGSKLRTLTRKEISDTSSTRELADEETASTGSNEYHHNIVGYGGPQTVISSRTNQATGWGEDGRRMGEIHVQNEMTVQIERT